MTQCSHCKSETELFDSGVPICVQCSEMQDPKPKPKPQVREAQIRAVLLDNLVDATTRASAASQEFNLAMSRYPDGLPYPQGSQQIHDASLVLAAARTALMKAHERLNDYLSRGILPEDLKRAG
jgi:hypothetical protein